MIAVKATAQEVGLFGQPKVPQKRASGKLARSVTGSRLVFTIQVDYVTSLMALRPFTLSSGQADGVAPDRKWAARRLCLRGCVWLRSFLSSGV